MIDRNSLPQILENPPFISPSPDYYPLDNQSKLFFFPDPMLDLIHVNVSIKAGSLFDTKKYIAIALFNFLKESSPDYPLDKMDNFLDFYGASWNTTVNLENVIIEWIVPKSNCEIVLPILFNTLLYPRFDENSFDNFKEQKIKDFEYNSRKFAYRATQLMFSTLFTENSPLATLLTPYYINSLSISDLYDFHNFTVYSQRVKVFVCGNYNDKIKNILISSLQKLSLSYAPITFTSHCYTGAPKSIFEDREKPLQSSVIMCKNLFDYNDPDRRDFYFLSTLLGGYFGSRLMQNLREKNGYTYGISNGISYYGNNSFYYIESDFAVEKTKSAVEACYDEMLNLQQTFVSEEEIDVVKRYIEGSLLRKSDGVISFMKYFSFLENFGNDENETVEMFNSINNISKEKIFTLANRYLKSNSFSLVVVGKYE